jgi:hypothetical protein
MNYSITKLDIPNLYNDIDKNYNKDTEINIFEFEFKPYEQHKIYNSCYAYCITNNTELYINGADFATFNKYNKRELLNIYNKMYLFLGYDCYIENLSNEPAYLKLILIDTYSITQLSSRCNFYKTTLFLMSKYNCVCTEENCTFSLIETIIIKTKQTIDVKYKYIDEKDILFCYKIKHIHNDLYELQICKITNKTNDKTIIIPQKNNDNIIQYYNNIYNDFNVIFNQYIYPIFINFQRKDMFNNYYIYYEVKKLDINPDDNLDFY